MLSRPNNFLWHYRWNRLVRRFNCCSQSPYLGHSSLILKWGSIDCWSVRSFRVEVIIIMSNNLYIDRASYDTASGEIVLKTWLNIYSLVVGFLRLSFDNFRLLRRRGEGDYSHPPSTIPWYRHYTRALLVRILHSWQINTELGEPHCHMVLEAWSA